MGHFKTAPLPLKIAVGFGFSTVIFAVIGMIVLGDRAAIPFVLLVNLGMVVMLATRAVVGRPDLGK